MTRPITQLISTIVGKTLTKAASKLTQIIHPRRSSFSFLMPGTKIDYARALGTGLESNVLMAPIMYIIRAFPESKMVVKTDIDDKPEMNSGHELVSLIRKPNPFYSGNSLIMATLLSRFLDGNSYWIKVRGLGGKVKELWYIPHWNMEPMWDDGKPEFIKFYRYWSGTTHHDILPSEIVHFRFGIDPENVRKGYSPLKSIVREAYMDSEASNLVSALLRNKGIPGLVIAPDKDVDLDTEDRKAMKDYVQRQFTGDNRFSTLVLGAPTKIQEFGFNPQEMDLGIVHNLSEERTCALIGLPAAVVGFGTGMEQTQVGATLAGLREIAWTDCIGPTQDSFADDITRSLLIPDFGGTEDKDEFAFDRSMVGALQGHLNAQSERLDRGVRGGYILVSEAREAEGWPVDDSHKIFLRPLAAIEVTEDGEEVIREGDGLDSGQPGGTPSDETETESDPDADEPPPQEEDDDDDDDEESAPKDAKRPRRLSRIQARLSRSMDRIKRRFQRGMVKRMRAFFEKLGIEIEKIWLEVGKASEVNLRVETLFSKIKFTKHEADLRAIFGSHYVAIFKETHNVVTGMGLGVNLPDKFETLVLRRGGTRAGLVDLTKKAKDRVFDVLAEARTEGWGVAKIARQLRKEVPAGPWLSSKTRADVIARTETWHAQTQSAIDVYSHTEGATAVQMLDARLGETDAECEATDGLIVSFDVARQLLESEHPNGTRDMVPFFGPLPDNALV